MKKTNRENTGKFGVKKQQAALRPGHYLVDSMSALREYCRHRPELIKELRCHKDVAKELLAEFPDLEKQVVVSHFETSFYAEVTAKVQDFSYLKKGLPEAERDLIIALDHVKDPRNLGAIARSAAFFGVKTMVIPRDRQVGLTDASFATAQGAFALLEIVEVPNLAQALEVLKDRSYWVIGTDASATELSGGVKSFAKRVLVMGAEDKGISRLVREKCDAFVGIPRIPGGLDSLNVSVAAGILLRDCSDAAQG